MGTFRVRAGSVHTLNGAWVVPSCGFSDACALGAFNQFPLVSSGTSMLYNSGFEAVTEVLFLVTADIDGFFLDGSETPISEDDLPSGFSIVDAEFLASLHEFGFASELYMRIGVTQTADLLPGTQILAWPGGPPTPNDILATSYGIRIINNDGQDSTKFGGGYIQGNYVIATYVWYLNPETNHFQYASEDPGAPWIEQDPVLDVTLVTPATGDVSGQDEIELTGTGFGDGATVKFGEIPATDVVVVDSTTITCTCPSHLAGTVQVVVTNLDGQTSA
jgi:hypothetical protein